MPWHLLKNLAFWRVSEFKLTETEESNQHTRQFCTSGGRFSNAWRSASEKGSPPEERFHPITISKMLEEMMMSDRPLWEEQHLVTFDCLINCSRGKSFPRANTIFIVLSRGKHFPREQFLILICFSKIVKKIKR